MKNKNSDGSAYFFFLFSSFVLTPIHLTDAVSEFLSNQQSELGISFPLIFFSGVFIALILAVIFPQDLTLNNSKNTLLTVFIKFLAFAVAFPVGFIVNDDLIAGYISGESVFLSTVTTSLFLFLIYFTFNKLIVSNKETKEKDNDNDSFLKSAGKGLLDALAFNGLLGWIYFLFMLIR